MREPRRIGAFLAGALGVTLSAVGIVLLLLVAGARDGFLTAEPFAVHSPTRAILAIDPRIEPAPPVVTASRAREFRVRAVSDGPLLFLGVGPRRRVEAYLALVDHERVEAIDTRGGPPRTARAAGRRAPPPPADRGLWIASDTGRSPELRWRPGARDLAVVLMNASGRPGLSADVRVGARVPLALGLGIIATLLGLAGIGAAAAYGRRGRDGS